MKCPCCAGRGAIDLPPQTLGERVKFLREIHGWTLADLASRAGMSATGLHHIEIGKSAEPRLPAPRGLAAAFGITLDQLLENVHAAERAAA